MIPSIPTDNPYKFGALATLAICLLSLGSCFYVLIFSEDEVALLNSKIHSIAVEQEGLKNRMLRESSDSTIVLEILAHPAVQRDSLVLVTLEPYLSRYEALDVKRAEYEGLVSHEDSKIDWRVDPWFLLAFFILSGIASAGLFYEWYNRFVKYRQALLMKEAQVPYDRINELLDLENRKGEKKKKLQSQKKKSE